MRLFHDGVSSISLLLFSLGRGKKRLFVGKVSKQFSVSAAQVSVGLSNAGVISMCRAELCFGGGGGHIC